MPYDRNKYMRDYYLRPEAREKILQRAREYQKSPRGKEMARRRRERTGGRVGESHRKYGLTLDQYHALYEKQNECCKICGDWIAPGKVCVDHDHTSGAVRGLLCSGCNLALGNFKERPEVMRAAASYIEGK